MSRTGRRVVSGAGRGARSSAGRGAESSAGDAGRLVLDEPLSLWGGVDPTTGTIVDVHHPQRGHCIAGRVVVMPSGRGSSSSASVLAEMARRGTAPAAIVLGEPDLILAIGAEVAWELYGVRVPVEVEPANAESAD